ncbi:MAG: PIN domain nuclease [Ignavibacteriales bacterium]|nr:PIN domain nuclease [Ignavibacteriales bacterium]
MILCDSSIWIRYFRKSKEPIVEAFVKLLLNDEVCINEYVYIEILQGCRNEEQFLSLKKFLRSIPMFERKGLETVEKAITIYRTCSAKSPRISKTIDTLIAATALENNLELFHLDKEFDVIAEYFPLKIYKWKK